MMTFEEWKIREGTDCNGLHEFTETETIIARHAWNFNGAQQAAAERDRIDDGIGGVFAAYSLPDDYWVDDTIGGVGNFLYTSETGAGVAGDGWYSQLSTTTSYDLSTGSWVGTSYICT